MVRHTQETEVSVASTTVQEAKGGIFLLLASPPRGTGSLLGHRTEFTFIKLYFALGFFILLGGVLSR